MYAIGQLLYGIQLEPDFSGFLKSCSVIITVKLLIFAALNLRDSIYYIVLCHYFLSFSLAGLSNTSGIARNFQEGVRNCVIQGRVHPPILHLASSEQ